MQTNSKNYSNSQINDRLQVLVSSERKISQEILELIQLVELRKLHLDMGYASVFEYLTKFLGYHESAAYRRMQAARLIKECPEMKESLQTGKLHLTQLAALQTAVKAEQRETKQIVSKDMKLEILKKLQNKNSEETQKILSQNLAAYEPHVKKSVQHKSDDTVYVTMHLTKDQFELLKQTQELLSHIENGKLEAVVESLCRKEVQKRTLPKKANKCEEVVVPNLIESKTTTLANNSDDPNLKAVKTDRKILSARSAIPAEVRRRVFRRDQSCQKCGSKFQLQIDHVKPIWAGGQNEESNLQLLCAVHNRWKYHKESGITQR